MSAVPGQGARVWRFDPLDRGGLFFGLGFGQILLLAAGFMAIMGTTLAHIHVLVGLGLLGLFGFAALVPVSHGDPIARLVPIWWQWFTASKHRKRWQVPLHLLTAEDPTQAPELPAMLTGLSLVSLPDVGWGAIFDRKLRTYTMVVPIGGQGFALRTEDEQAQLLDSWGAVWSAFATERSPVTRLTWSDVARAGSMTGHEQWLAGQAGAALPAAKAYRELVATLRPICHDQVVTVTVQTRNDKEAGVGVLDVVRPAVDALYNALTSAGLWVGSPLVASDIAVLQRCGLDPSGSSPSPEATTSLAQRMGVVVPGGAAALDVNVAADRITVDGSLHRTWWVEGWPRLPQRANWARQLLVALPAGVQRTFTVVIEPVPQLRAFRRIRSDDLRLTGDAAARSDAGRRVDGRSRRAQKAVLDREEELVAGFAEVGYAGLLTLTAKREDTAELERASLALEQVWRSRGVELRRLWGRQDSALAAAMPLGIGLVRTAQL